MLMSKEFNKGSHKNKENLIAQNTLHSSTHETENYSQNISNFGIQIFILMASLRENVKAYNFRLSEKIG